MAIGVTPTKLNEIADRIWQMVLGFRLTPIKSEPQRPKLGDFVFASVTISGAWQGVLTLGCSTGVARRAAAAMFRKKPQDIALREISDALGELTNMVGGNVKTLIKGECTLSVPNFVETIPDPQQGSALERCQWFKCEGGSVLVHILEQGTSS